MHRRRVLLSAEPAVGRATFGSAGCQPGSRMWAMRAPRSPPRVLPIVWLGILAGAYQLFLAPVWGGVRTAAEYPHLTPRVLRTNRLCVVRSYFHCVQWLTQIFR